MLLIPAEFGVRLIYLSSDLIPSRVGERRKKNIRKHSLELY